MDSASITFNPRLRELLDSGNFDWDNEYHREAYLKAWSAVRLNRRMIPVPIEIRCKICHSKVAYTGDGKYICMKGHIA